MKFLCVGVNPAFDLTLTLDGFSIDHVNRVQSEERHAAGKAVNVANHLHEAGCDCSLALFLGKDNSFEFLNAVNGIPVYYQLLPGSTRENITLLIRKRTVKINRNGPRCTVYDLSALGDIISEQCDADTIAIFNGAMTDGMNEYDYSRLVSAASDAGARVVIDTDALSREEIIYLKPWLYKPNEFELARLYGAQEMTYDQLLMSAKDLIENGVGIVLLTLGAKGLVAISAEKTCRIKLPPIDAVNTVGAGDKTLAAYLANYAAGYDMRQCASSAAIAGARYVSAKKG